MNIGHAIKVFFSGGEVAYQAKSVVREVKREAWAKDGNLGNAFVAYFQTTEDSDAVTLEVYKRIKHLQPFLSEQNKLKKMARMIVSHDDAFSTSQVRLINAICRSQDARRELQRNTDYFEGLKRANGERYIPQFMHDAHVRRNADLTRKFEISEAAKNDANVIFESAKQQRDATLRNFDISVRNSGPDFSWKKLAAFYVMDDVTQPYTYHMPSKVDSPPAFSP